MIKTMDLGAFCAEHTDELVDRLVDYCIKTYGEREGAIRALAAVGVGTDKCTSALPHAAHLADGCPGLSLTEWIAAGGEQPRRAIDPDPSGQLAATAWLSDPEEDEANEAEYLRELNQDAAQEAAEADR